MFYNKALAWDHINLKYRWTPVSRIRPHVAQYSGEWSFVTQPSKQQARVHRIELEVARTGIWKTTIKLGFFLSCAPPKPHCPTWELGNDECSDESRGLPASWVPTWAEYVPTYLNIPLSSKTPVSTTSNYALEEKEGMDKHSSWFAGGLLRTVTKIRHSGALHVVLPPCHDKMPVVPFVSIALFV